MVLNVFRCRAATGCRELMPGRGERYGPGYVPAGESGEELPASEPAAALTQQQHGQGGAVGSERLPEPGQHLLLP